VGNEPELTLQTAAELVDLERSFQHAAMIVSRGRQAFDGDEILRLAAEAVSNRLGEAVARLDSSWRASRPDVPWRAIRDNRNFIVHVYQLIDYEQLWNTIAVDVPAVWEVLKPEIAQAHVLLEADEAQDEAADELPQQD
jgi:uncharacterized protein with HEPN domain